MQINPKKSLKVLFRVDAGPGMGLGHLQRCLSLAKALEQEGANSIFLARSEEAVRQRVSQSQFSFEALNGTHFGGKEDLASVLDVYRRHKVDVLVVDSYYAGPEYLDALKKEGLFVVVVDDLARHPFSCDMVVNGAACAEKMSYDLESKDTLFLLGLRYVLLRPELWNNVPRPISEKVKNVLVVLGAGDKSQLMPDFFSLLDRLPSDFTVTAVVGPFFEHRLEIEKMVRLIKKPVELIYNPDSVSSWMGDADLAISAGGQTLYELVAMGVPTIAVSVTDNQNLHMNALAEYGAIYPVKSVQRPALLNELEEVVVRLLRDDKVRISLHKNATSIIDKKGSLRVAHEIYIRKIQNEDPYYCRPS